MEVKEVIEKLMRDKGISQGDLKELMQMSSQSGVSQAIRRDMRISMLSRFLSVLDSQLIIRDRNGNEFCIGGCDTIRPDLDELLSDDLTQSK